MFKEIRYMKKNYIYSTVESVKVNAQMHLCDASPVGGGGTQVGGGTLGGGDIPGNPNDNL